MEEQYGITDLTHYMNGRVFTAVPQPPPQPQQQQPPHDLHYDMVMMGGGGGGMMFRSDSTTGTGSTTASLSAGGGGGGLEMEIGGGLEMEIGGGGGGGNGRWPRQETLTLLEVRSRLDSKFKEANQKGPLWDEVSRIMSEEHGYQRSGKKCREKFENLYKYYKKTKEGKAGRQDGKHYRFFRQLEALYGETSTSISIISPNVNPNPNVNPPSFSDPHNFNVETCALQGHPHPNNSTFEQPFQTAHSPSLSNNSSPFDTSSSGYTNPNAAMPTFLENGDSADRIMNKRRLGKRSWKAKIKDFIDAQMRKIMEKQEEWMEKMMKSIEQKEEERVLREEQWRKEEASRFEKEHKFWANERAWMESRDSALMEALHKLTDKESNRKTSPDDLNLTSWGENEITRLIQIRTSMETRFEQGRYVEELLWEEIASKMACLGYSRNGVTCKNKWDNINEFLMRTKKRKENNRSSNSYTHHNNESLSHIVHHQVGSYRQNNDQNNDGSYRFLMGDPENVWDGYGMKVGKDEEH